MKLFNIIVFFKVIYYCQIDFFQKIFAGGYAGGTADLPVVPIGTRGFPGELIGIYIGNGSTPADSPNYLLRLELFLYSLFLIGVRNF